MRKNILVLFLCVYSNLMNGQSNKKFITSTLLIHHITIVDVVNNQLHQDQSIYIENDQIIATGETRLFKKSYTAQTIINGKGKFILPSLWDMHVHFGGDTLVADNKLLLPLYIAMGISHVRDCAGDISKEVIQWKKAIEQKSLLGPTIFTSGPKLEGPASIWPGDLEIANEIELALALDSLKKLAVDFIKITDNTLPPSLFLKSIVAARKQGWKVSGHAPATISIQTLSDSGLSTIEHLGYLLRSASAEEEKITQLKAAGKITSRVASEMYINSFDSAIAMEKFKALAKNGTAVVPTMNGSYITTYLDINDHQKDAYLKYIGPALRRTYGWRVERAAKDNKEAIAFRHQNFEASAKLLPLLQKAGVTLLAGTDAGYLNSYNYPGLGMHEELAMMVKYGLSPQEALKASIVNGPAFFMLSDQFGAVEKGKKAALLILNGNPLADIQNTKLIDAVIQNGMYLDRNTLNGLLNDVEKAVQKLK